MNGKPQHEHIVHLGNTPEYLAQYAQFPNLTLAISAKVLSKAVFDHGIRTSFIKKLPDIIGNPQCLFKSANPNQSDSVVVLTFEVQGSSPIVIPIRKNQQVGRTEYYNLVTSIYGKDGPDPARKWKRDNLLLWEP